MTLTTAPAVVLFFDSVLHLFDAYSASILYGNKKPPIMANIA